MNTLDTRGNPLPREMIEAAWHFHHWLAVLCSPPLLRSLRRAPIPQHIVRLLDAYLPYASGKQIHFLVPDDFQIDPQQREALTLKLRDILQRWTPPDIPEELVEAARALMRAEGVAPPGDERVELDPEFPPEECLMWPEGIPRLLKEREGKG